MTGLNSLTEWINHIIANNSSFTTSAFAILFLLIFIETAGIIIGFIPGDTILLTMGSLAGDQNNLWHYGILVLIFGLASLSGDAVNYFFGAFLVRQLSRFKWVDRHLNGQLMVRLTENFHRRRWLLFITVGRFMPFIRSVVPLLAHKLGLPFTDYIKMAGFASFLWSLSIVSIGYFFGQLHLPGGGLVWLILGFIAVFAIILSRPQVRERIIRLFLNK